MTLQDQYTLIKENKGNKEIFLKQAKSLFPQYVTNASTFQETTSILKQKGIISEAIGGIVTTGTTPDWVSIFKKNIAEAANEAKAIEKKTTKYVTDAEIRNYDYKDEKNINNVSFNQYLLGLSIEIDNPKNADKNVDELKAIVTKNLTKDNKYYLKNGQFGIEGLGYTDELPGHSKPKEAKGKYKASGYGNLKESMFGRSPQIGDNVYEYQFNTWKEKLYSIIMNDAGLDKDEISMDELELQKYFNANMSPEQVYNNVWLKDAGNFRSTGLFEGFGEEDRDTLIDILFKYIKDPMDAEDQADVFEMTGKFSDERLEQIDNDEEFIKWLKGKETPYEDSKYDGYVTKDMGGNSDIYESKLRKVISKLIKEAIDIKAIENAGNDASDRAKAKLIDREILRRKKKLKALITLKELEEDSINPKKIKELNDDIKKLEKLKSKLSEFKKSSKSEQPKEDIITERSKEEIAAAGSELDNEIKNKEEQKKAIDKSIQAMKKAQSTTKSEQPTDAV